MASERSMAERREPHDLRPWIILGVGLGTAAFLVASMAALYAYYAWTGAGGFGAPVSHFPPPVLQSDPSGDLRALQAAQQAELTGYAWVDREHGLVRIPIGRAMAIIAGRGADAYAPLQSPPDTPPHVRPEAAQ